MKVSAAMGSTAAFGLVFAGTAMAAGADDVNWSSVPVKTVTLFYPAQSTYQWLRSPEHPGAQPVASGAPCATCHTGQEQQKGASLAKGGKLEPTPIAGREGAKQLSVQAAYDRENAYFRFQWRTAAKGPGEPYPFLRFDGKEWKPYGGPRLAKAVQSGAQPAIYEDRLSMMIDDGGVPGFAAQGCWLTCHDGERDSRGQASAAEVAANDFFKAIKRADVRKYLPATRTDANASWDKGVSVEQIAKLKSQGHFLDLIQWRAHRSNPVGMADDGYVLEWRNFDAGRNPFSSNMDAKTKQPRYMYDAKKVGKNALAIDDIRQVRTVIVREEGAVPFDPNLPWKAGDLLPQYVVSRADASGSAADNKDVKGVWKDGMWTVTWTRPLNLANPDDKALREGRVYNVGFAVHDDNVTSRAHHVSFPVTLGFGARATIEATRLK
jgi:hypothetical protein